jgi:hypothetical protein
VDSINADSSFSTASEGSTILRLAIIVYFAVDVQPRFLLLRRKIFHDLHQVSDHFLTNSPHQRRAFRCDANHYLAAILARHRAHHHSEIFEARNQAARRSRGVPHFLRDRRHSQDFLLIEISQKKKLRERNIAGRKLFTEMQNKASLHFQNDVGKPLGVSTDFRGWCKRRFRVQSVLS